MSTLQEIIKIIEDGANSAMKIEDIIRLEIDDWKKSGKRELMEIGERYYAGDLDIKDREKKVIGANGTLIEAKNVANNKLEHNFVRKLVDQKTGYLLSKPISIQTENEQYEKALSDFFDKSFLRQLKTVGKTAINKGIGWLHVYYNDKGELKTKLIPSEEIIPLWKDSSHTELDGVIRMYTVEVYEGRERKDVTKVELWDTNGVRRYIDGKTQEVGAAGLTPDVEAGDVTGHFLVGEEYVNWERIPFIPFKYNEEEIPLVKFLKSLVDDYDRQVSDNSNNLEDLPNFTYILKNYDGTDLGEFRQNMKQFKAVKVSGDGGLDTVQVKIDTEAFKTHIEILRKNIYEFGRGIDTQSDKFGNSPTGIALRFLYADLDMDANIIETEFQASLEELLWFIDTHLYNTTAKDYFGESVDIIFNRDILINETESIENAIKSKGTISDETIIANHPWTTNVRDEIERLNQQRQADRDYAGFGEFAAGDGE